MPNTPLTQISGLDKAVQLLMMLPKAESAQIMALLPQHHAEKLTMEIIRPERIRLSVDECEALLGVAREEIQARDYIKKGGVEYARALLSEVYGSDRAEEILVRLIATLEVQPFHYLNEIDPAHVATIVQEEHPQTIALILSYLSMRHAATVLSALPGDLQGSVARRLSTIQPVSPTIVAQMEEALRERASTLIDQDNNRHTGGVEFVVKALTQAGRSTERNVLEWLDEKDPTLSGEIRKKMFVFDNIVTLDDRSTQRILRDVDSKDLVVALRGAAQPVRDHILKNLSQRAATTLTDELEMGAPIRLSLVEEAQQRIVSVIRRLEEAEEISLARGGDDVLV